MTSPDGSLDEMRRLFETRCGHDRLALDDQTAERLLSGSLAAGDAPPEYRLVAAALQGVAQGSSASELAGESHAVEAIAAAVASAPSPPTPRRSTVFTKFRSAKVAAAALVGGLSL